MPFRRGEKGGGGRRGKGGGGERREKEDGVGKERENDKSSRFVRDSFRWAKNLPLRVNARTRVDEQTLDKERGKKRRHK